MKITNIKKPKNGDVAIIKTKLIFGHVAVVTNVGKKHITIQEGNWIIGKITERHDTPASLRIAGYFRKEALDKKSVYAMI